MLATIRPTTGTIIQVGTVITDPIPRLNTAGTFMDTSITKIIIVVPTVVISTSQEITIAASGEMILQTDILNVLSKNAMME